jgi:hypothetical protein
VLSSGFNKFGKNFRTIGILFNHGDEVIDNKKLISKLAIKNNSKMSSQEALTLSEARLDKGYKEVRPGPFVSSDGTR